MSRRRIRWVSAFGALAVVALALSLLANGLPVALGAPGAQSEALPPQVFDTVPLPGEELALDGTVTFFFDQPMDAASVEAAFRIEPEVAGTLNWPDASTLRFTPQGAFARAADYTFTIDASAASAEGVTMAEPFELTLRTVGYLEVTEVLPAPDSESVAADSVITVIFNRPVVPLVSIEDMGDLPQPLVFDPPVNGKGEWLNTSIYLFRPDVLVGGINYTVTVAAGLEDVTGGVLGEPFSWSFATLPPDITEIVPRDGRSGVLLESPVSVQFTQPMDHATTEAAVKLLLMGTMSANLEVPVPVSGQYSWNESSTRLTFQPDEMLELGSTYQLVVDEMIARSAEGAMLREGASSTFTTVPYPAIVRTSPANYEVDASPYGGFTVYFNTPIDLESLKDKFIVEPEPWREYDSYYYDWSYSYTLSFDTEPSTDYTITILPGIKDHYGNVIQEGMVVSYRTAPYPPELDIQATGRIGMYSAYKPSTRVFVTHRNVSRMELGLWKLELPVLAQMTGPNGWDYWYAYRPRAYNLLRRWTVDVSSQIDQRRYELLYISDKGASGISNLECLGAPDPQVKVGDVVIVTREDARPLNVRAEPDLAATVITQALPDETLQVIGGPFCEGGYLWWNVRLNNDLTGWAAEGDPSHYYFEPLSAAPQDPNLPAAPTAAPYTPEALAPGVYYLEIDSPETRDFYNEPNRHVLVVQSANITLKYSQETALAWVTDMQSGDPLPGLPVIFYNKDFNPVGTATTDADGLAVADIPHLVDLYLPLYASVDHEGMFGFAVGNWSDGMEPWMFDVSSDYQKENLSVYLYTDRPIYRPDQPVYFKGIVRAMDDVRFSLPNRNSVPVQIFDDRGEIVYDEVLPLTPQGSFSGEFRLDPEAPLGYYRLIADIASNSREGFGISFSVAEYRAPEFQVELTPDASEVVQGDTIRVLVESRYFFGGAVSNAQVAYSVVSQDYYFNYTGDQPGYWSFVDENYDFYSPEYYETYGQTVAEGESVTDAMGRFMIELPADLGKKARSQTLTIEARVTDESDQLVAGRVDVVVHQGLVYLGLQPEEYVGRAEHENLINMLVVDWDSAPVAGQEVAYEIVERRWFSVQEEDEFGRTTWTWEVEEIPVEGGSGTVTTDADGLAQVSFVPPTGGTYKVYGRTTDSRGNEVKSSAFMWVSGPDFINWRQDNSNRIQLITDKDEYKVGDTAEILIPSPFQGPAWALITVERGDILTHDVILMETNSTIYTLDILPEHAPNIYVSVVLVKGEDANTPNTAFRMGMVNLPVDTSRLVMDLAVEPSINVAAGEFAGPGDTVEYTITATDWQGEPVAGAEIGVGLTDLAVLTIAPPNSQELLPFFYSERGVAVRTASALTISVDQATQVIIDTIKGGGGGYGEGGVFEVRQEFVDTPLWEPSVITDEDGTATVSVTLPDNLTTWRLDARAVTVGGDEPMLVGQTTFDLLSTKPVLIRPATSRFFVVGDHATLGATVNNNTGQDLVTDITLQGTGFVLDEGVTHTQRVTIPARGRARVNWPVTVQDVAFIDATFYANANNGQYLDASKPPLGQGEDQTLPVYKYEVPETVGTAGMLVGPEQGSRTEAIVLPRRFNVTQGEITVRVDRSLAAATVDGLDWLRNYPHYCIEQIVSRFLPNAVTVRALTALNVDASDLRANLDREVNFALQRLYSQQKADGGWGWFVNDESNVLVTAYALIGLNEAQMAGYSVDQGVIDRAAAFVEQSLRTIRPQNQRWEVNRQAFLLYTLARVGKGDFARSVRLFDEMENMSLYAQAYLAMTFHLLDPNDPRAMELINHLNNSLVVSATGAHWEENYTDWWNWNTDTRTTALGLMAIIQVDPENQLIPNIVRWLMVARDADHWETTQETAWAVMALTEWMVVTNELNPDYTFNLSLNGQRLSVEDNTATPDNVRETEQLVIAVSELLADQANRLTISRTEGDGNLYYTTHLRAFLPVPDVEPVSRGIILSRQYSLLGDPDARPITSAEVGQAVQVTLTIIAPNNLHYVMVEDPIPAGADAVNPDLQTSSIIGTRPELSRERPLSRGWGWWWFSNVEMRDEKVVLYATYLPRGTYQFTYTIYPGLPGEYNVIPATGQEFYFPEVYGRTAGSLFTITGGTASEAVPVQPGEEMPVTSTGEPGEAAESPAETPTPQPDQPGGDAALPELEQVYTSPDGVTVRFPATWAVADDQPEGMTTLVSQPGMDTDRVLPGQVGVVVIGPDMTAMISGMSGATETSPAEIIANFISLVMADEGEVVMGEMEEIVLGDRIGVMSTIADPEAEGLIAAFDGGDGQLVMALGVTAPGEFAAAEPLVRAIMATVTTVPAEEPAIAAPVLTAGETQSYNSRTGLSLLLPNDWAIEENEDAIQATNDLAALQGDDLQPGQQGMIIFTPGMAEALGAANATDLLSIYASIIAQDNTTTQLGVVEEVELADGRTAARIPITEGGTEGVGYAVDVSGTPILIFGVAAMGELAEFEPLLLEMIMSIAYTP